MPQPTGATRPSPRESRPGAEPEHAANIQEELPAPRNVRVARADTLFEDGLDLELGGTTVQVRHVGGDHAGDSTVMYVQQDRLLFLGDALYESTGGEAGGAARTLTAERAFPLLDVVRAFDAGSTSRGTPTR